MFWFLLAVAGAAFYYFALVKPFRRWSDRGVVQPSLSTLWKTNLQTILQTKSQVELIKEAYMQFTDQRYTGSYQFFTAALFLRDPDLIKQVTVKDFDHFVDHNQFISEEAEPLWGKNLFSLRGDRWRDMRATLSPSFTSSKMRAMFGLMTECAQQFVGHLEKADSKMTVIEFKDAFTRYANDVIASTAFGITSDSMKDKENEFYVMGKEATNFKGFWMNLKFLLMLVSPKLSKILRVTMFPARVSAFFRRLVKTNIESREKNGIVRPDMIHLLMEARKGRLKHDKQEETKVVDNGFAVIEESSIGKEEKRQKLQLTDDDITAQALIFFFAGFESVSVLMCFTIYELAVNPDVQTKLQEEIDETLQNCNGTITYEALLKMNYLDKVISESLRKWPAAVVVDRICVKPYTIQPTRSSETSLSIQKGDVLWIPIFALHRDPRFYPEPDRFDPERFSEENKSKIYPYSYIPFGAGPRSCIGNRFALLENKIVMFFLLSKFNIIVVDKSPVPMKLARNQFNLTAEKGFWFGLEPRVAN